MKGFPHPFNKTAKLVVTCKALAKIYFMLLVNFLPVLLLSSVLSSYMILTEVTLISKRFVPCKSLKKESAPNLQQTFHSHNNNAARLELPAIISVLLQYSYSAENQIKKKKKT